MKWSQIMSPEILKLGDTLEAKAQACRDADQTIYPPQNQIFRALSLTTPDTLKICVVGQDPYINPGQANGLAFSVAPGVTPPPSLQNIFKELVADIGCPYPKNGDLTPWAERGIMLLNTSLTVQAGQSNSHAGWGWHEFTKHIFTLATRLPQPVVFILWGGNARAFVADLQISTLWNQKKACIWSSHPSPLGATKGSPSVPAFIGSRPFSKANDLLVQLGGEPVDWRL